MSRYLIESCFLQKELMSKLETLFDIIFRNNKHEVSVEDEKRILSLSLDIYNIYDKITYLVLMFF